MSIGNRVFLKRPMPSQELLEGFAGLPAANIADTMGRSCAMNPRIRRMSGFQGVMVGPALTVKARAGDNLFLHQALDMAQPGDIIVVSNDEDQTRSLMGEIMFTYAKYQRKLGGLVLDGRSGMWMLCGRWICRCMPQALLLEAPTRRDPERSMSLSPAAGSASTPATSSWQTPMGSS